MKTHSKRKINNGDLLEAIMWQIEHILKTNPNTRIYSKHKIPDRHGKLREHDIYVETEVNNKVLKYSIECKSYGKKSPIKMSHIAEFNDKIQDRGIYGIFVSNGNFQKNAIDKAKQLSIDIYSITEDDSDVKPISDLHLFLKDYQLKSAIIGIKNQEHFKKIENGLIKHLYLSDKKTETPFDVFINSYLPKMAHQYYTENIGELFKPFMDIGDDSFTLRTGEIIAVVDVKPIELYYRIGNQYYEVDLIRFQYLLTHKVTYKKSPPTYKLVSLLNGEELLTYFAVLNQGSKNDTLVNFVKPKNSELKISVVDPTNLEERDQISFTAQKVIFEGSEYKLSTF